MINEPLKGKRIYTVEINQDYKEGKFGGHNEFVHIKDVKSALDWYKEWVNSPYEFYFDDDNKQYRNELDKLLPNDWKKVVCGDVSVYRLIDADSINRVFNKWLLDKSFEDVKG